MSARLCWRSTLTQGWAGQGRASAEELERRGAELSALEAALRQRTQDAERRLGALRSQSSMGVGRACGIFYRTSRRTPAWRPVQHAFHAMHIRHGRERTGQSGSAGGHCMGP